MDRRTFVKGTFLGGAGLLLHGFAVRAQSDASAPALPPIETHGLPQVKPSPLGMPGLFPGRVVEVSNANAIARNRVAQPEIKVMIERGMKELTSESSLPAAWRRFIGPADILGIQITPSGAPGRGPAPGLRSGHAARGTAVRRP